jgi:hypothetical protein
MPPIAGMTGMHHHNQLLLLLLLRWGLINVLPGLAAILLTSASQKARNADMSHHSQLQV